MQMLFGLVMHSSPTNVGGEGGARYFTFVDYCVFSHGFYVLSSDGEFCKTPSLSVNLVDVVNKVLLHSHVTDKWHSLCEN